MVDQPNTLTAEYHLESPRSAQSLHGSRAHQAQSRPLEQHLSTPEIVAVSNGGDSCSAPPPPHGVWRVDKDHCDNDFNSRHEFGECCCCRDYSKPRRQRICCDMRRAVLTVNILHGLVWTTVLGWIVMSSYIQSFFHNQTARAESLWYDSQHRVMADEYNENVVDDENGYYAAWSRYFYDYFGWNDDEKYANTTSSYWDWSGFNGTGSSYWDDSYSDWFSSSWSTSSPKALPQPSLARQCAAPMARIAASVAGIIGAIHFSIYWVSVALIAYGCVCLLYLLHTNFAQALMTAGLFLYPHAMFIHEVRRGVLNPETYDAATCCCCM
jgi:hypothetical protein